MTTADDLLAQRRAQGFPDRPSKEALRQAGALLFGPENVPRATPDPPPDRCGSPQSITTPTPALPPVAGDGHTNDTSTEGEAA